MATVNKNFRIKDGLIVEGTTGTINGEDILTTGSNTDSLAEGTTNLYFTAERAANAVADEISTAVSGAINALTTDDIEEGEDNLYFTDSRALTATASAYDAAGAAVTAESNANDYTDTALESYTPTSGLDAAVDGYGYLKSADLSGYATESYVGSQGFITSSALTGYATETYVGSQGFITSSALDGYATESYVGSAISTAASNYDAAGAASTAESNANDYTDTAISGLSTVYDALGAASTAEQNAKDYADAIAQGLTVKESVLIAIDDFPLTPPAPGEVLDGVTMAEGDRFLVKSTNPSHLSGNGIYVITAGGSARASDQLTPEKGDYVFVESGTYTAQGYIVTDVTGSDVTWTQFSAAGQYTASTGITITGNAISVTANTYDAYGAASSVASDLSDHISDTSAHGVSGDVVGTSDEQDLSNKTFLGQTNFQSAGGAGGTNNYIDVSNSTGKLTVNSGYALDVTASNNVKIASGGGNIVLDADTGSYLGSAVTGNEIATQGWVGTNYVNVDDLPGQLDNYVPTSEKGQALGVATLDADGYVPSSQLNIDVSGDISTAINALTTDDIEEGETNLYFTDGRAQDAISGADIYPNAVIINNVSKNVATTQTVSSASTVTALQWAKADFVSAKLLVKAVNATDSQVSEVLVTLDSSDNVAVTEFAMVYTAGELATVTADVSGANVRIRVTTVGSSTDVTVFGTLLV